MYGERTPSLPKNYNGNVTYGVLLAAKASQYRAQIYFPNYNVSSSASPTDETRCFIRSYTSNTGWTAWTALKIIG